MKLTAGAFQQLRFTGILLLLAVVTAAGLIYWSSVQQQRQYLGSRDFRLLTVLAGQVQSLLDDNARIFQGAVEYVYRANDVGENADRPYASVKEWRDKALGFVPILRDADFAFGQPPSAAIRSAVARPTVEVEGSRSRLHVDVVADGNLEPVLKVRVPLAALLEPTFTSKLRQGVFDTLALATPDGRVIFVTGRRQQELQSTPLDAMLPATIADAKRFQQLARTISVQDANVAGVRYNLFIQPCCASVALNARPGDPAGAGLLVAGLIEADQVYGSALAISPTLVIAGVVATLLAVVMWPFLKLSFVGERQRVTVWDVVQLAACSIFGLALAAIIIITSDVYARLNGDLDEQLEHLAVDIRDHVHSEIELAYGQLSLLQGRFKTSSTGMFPCVVAGEKGEHCSGSRKPMAGPSYASYQDYEAFALIDERGRQQVKATPRPYVPNRLRVQGRAYVDAIVTNRYWRSLKACSAGAGDDGGDPGCFLESVWSWTDAQPQAVLSKPTGSTRYPVASLAFPARAMIDPVLPPGFEYAVVDGNGTVLFHSDRQRNIQENLFIETDQNRRLRALVSGHSSGAVSIMYWGRQYRAYVEPAGIPDWSVVALSDQRAIRGLVLEWTAVSLLMLSLYLVAWILAIVVAIKSGASWMWPDIRRRWQYAALAAIYVVLFVTFAAVAFTGDTRTLLASAVAIPAAAWAMAFVVLRHRPSNLKIAVAQRGSAAARGYALAGALFLVLSGIVPGVGFVVRSYDMHVESYIKHRQLGLARALAARAVQTDGKPICGADRVSELDRNCLFFYDTTVKTGPYQSDEEEPLKGASGPNTSDAAAHHGLLQSLIEEYLPYYAESSVEMRELLHNHAADDSWWSARGGDGDLELHLRSDPPKGVLQSDHPNGIVVRSSLPAPVPFWAKQARPVDRHHAEAMLVMPYLAPLLLVCLGGVAYTIVRFTLRHVYLIGVSEPLWATGRLVATAGANVLILCDDTSKLAGQLQDTSILALGPIAASTDPGSAWRRALMQISRGDAGHAVVVTDLDRDLENVDMTRAKLEFLDELVNDPARTIVVLMQNPPALLQDSLRRGQTEAQGDLWPRLFKAFVVVDWRDTADMTRQSIPVTVESPTQPAATAESPRQPKWWRRWLQRAPAEPRSTLGGILTLEGRNDRFIRSICEDIRQSDAFRSGSLARDQILDEIDDRASAYYRRLWASCSDDEKVVLGHVAMDGLTNAASRRVVRRLLVRRLLTKDPDLRLMNRTFQNFILSPEIMRQVAQLEGVAEPSTWDRLRLPFALTAASAAAFLFTTQREMFNQTVTVVTAVAAAIPTVFRAVSVMAQRDVGAGPPRA